MLSTRGPIMVTNITMFWAENWKMSQLTYKWVTHGQIYCLNTWLYALVTRSTYNYLIKNSNPLAFGVLKSLVNRFYTSPNQNGTYGIEIQHAFSQTKPAIYSTIQQFISLPCCFSLSSLFLSSHQCPLLETNKHGWVDCWQRQQTKSCVNTPARTLAHHGPLIRWLMASFSAVHPSTSHPSLLSPSVLTLPPSFFSSLCSLSFYGVEMQHCQCNSAKIQYFSHLPPPTSSTHPATSFPIFIFLYCFILLCFRSGSFVLFLSSYSSLLLAGHLADV